MSLKKEVQKIKDSNAERKVNLAQLRRKTIADAFQQAAKDYSHFLDCVEEIEPEEDNFAIHRIKLLSKNSNPALYQIYKEFCTSCMIGVGDGEVSCPETAEKIEKTRAFKSYAKPIEEAGYHVNVDCILEVFGSGPDYLKTKNVQLIIRPK